MILSNPITSGNTADIYLCDGRIVKLFKEHLPSTEAEYEANKQRHAFSCGLRVPEVFGVTVINKRQAIIMEYVQGDTLGSLIYSNTSKAEHYMRLSVDVQIKMHGIKSDLPELLTDRLRAKIEAAPLLNKEQKQKLIQKLSDMGNGDRLCHGDFHINNLILKSDGITIIDWVDSSTGNASADVCRSFLLYSQYSSELAAMYLRIYCEKSGLNQGDILAWEPIIAGARLTEGVSSDDMSYLLNIIERG